MAVKNKSKRKKRMGGNADMMKMVGDMGQKIIDQHGDKIAEHGHKLMQQAVAAAVPMAIAGIGSYASKKLGSMTSKPVYYNDYNDYDDELSEDEYEQDGGKKNKKYKKSRMTKKNRKSKRKSKKH